MTQIALKINCRDSNPPAVLAENLPFLENISGPFSLKFNILLVFETLPS